MALQSCRRKRLCETPPRSNRLHHWMGQENRGYSIHTWNIPLNMYFSTRNNKNRIIPISLSVSLSLGLSNYHLCVFISCLYSPQYWGLNWVWGGCLSHFAWGVKRMEFISDGLYGLFVHKVLKHSKPHPSVTPETNTTKSFGPNLQPQHLSISYCYSQSLAHKAETVQK